jgi:hypothetical protein
MENTVDSQRRETAIKRIKDKEGFRIDLISYLAFTAVVVVIWAVTGSGYFWPIWLIGLWGMGVILHAYAVYVARPVTEDRIQSEMQNLT